MSNPVATIGNFIPKPGDPRVERNNFTAVVFQAQDFFTYADGQFDPTYSSFDPSTLGQRFFIFVQLEDVLDPAKTGAGTPQFVTSESWANTVKHQGSGFVTGKNSVMPKLFIPSEELVDNGIITTNKKLSALVPNNLSVEAFNWNIKTFGGASIATAAMSKYAGLGAFFGSQYVTLRAKNNNTPGTSATLVMELDPPPVLSGTSAPTSGPQGWEGDGTTLVVNGAFVLMLNVVPVRTAGANPQDNQDNPWEFKISFGDVEMWLNTTGALEVGFTSDIDRETNTVTVNLSEGKAKESNPQTEHIDDKTPFIIQVYPVWNGIIIMSGNQQSREVVDTTSTYLPMKKGRSVLVSPYSNGFDPANPAPVEVGVGTGSSNTIPDFGNKMIVTAKNVKFDIAYQPCFFSKKMWFDEWFVANDDVQGTVEYTYNVYPIWTANGTTATLDSLSPNKSATAGPVDDTSYWYVKWRMEMNKHHRYAGELLGAIFEVTEARDFPIRNDNGEFELNWTGGTPGDPTSSGDWRDYVQSISVSVSKDGSSGSISVDKYGVAGQDAVATQDIGAVTINMTGGFDTVAGSVFQGLGMGVSDNKSVDGATWEIPLVGLEKKLDDIALINVPFFDGDSVANALYFLTRYAGLRVDFSFAPNASAQPLSASEDVNVARFDWKSGTSVKSAMDDVCADVQYSYVIRDGTVYVYELDFQGIPVYPGPDRSLNYSGTNIINEDESPNFDVLRNEILVIGLEASPEGKGTDIQNIPTFPRFESRATATVPEVPWAKSIVRPIPGTLTEAELSAQADRVQSMSRNYRITGRTTIPGNADIKPYDRWGNYYIYSVSHNIDLVSKVWTTDLEFESPA